MNLPLVLFLRPYILQYIEYSNFLILRRPYLKNLNLNRTIGPLVPIRHSNGLLVVFLRGLEDPRMDFSRHSIWVCMQLMDDSEGLEDQVS